MAIAAALKFTQATIVGDAGFAFVGVAGQTVTCANGDNTLVTRWVFTILDVPPGSVITLGVKSDGPSNTFTFTPDVIGSYRVQVDVYSPFNLFHATDIRAFIVPNSRGWMYPAFRDTAAEYNFKDAEHPAGNTRGWTTALEKILKDLESLVSTLASSFPIQQVGTPPSFAGTLVTTPGFAGNQSVIMSGAGTGGPEYFNTNLNDANADQFSYASQKVVGDFEFVCRANTTTLGGLQQAGVALREDTTATGRSVSVFYAAKATTNVPPENDPIPRDMIQMISRPVGGIPPGSPGQMRWARATPNPACSPYVWFKIARVGNDIGTYWSRNGRQWIPIAQNVVFTPTGPVNIGFFVASQSQSTPVSVIFDSIYIGPVRQAYKTTWIGNTYLQASKGNLLTTFGDGYVSTYANALYVALDGTTYVSGQYDEFGQASKIYKDGHILRTNTENAFFGSNGGYEGSVAGNATQIFWYVPVSGGATGKNIFQTNIAGDPVRTITWTNTIGAGGVTGMCCANAGTNELYVSDLTNNRILVVNTATGAEIPGRAFAFTQGRPGPITVDSRGNLWIIQEGATSPILNKYVATLAKGVYCYSAAGVDLAKSITDIDFPSDVAISPIADELWVCDNGPNQQIRIYTGLTTSPAINRTFGVTGGIYSGATPGLLFDAAAGGWRRLYSLTGIKFDSAGSIYVTCEGRGADIRKFDTSGNLIWKVHSSLDAFGCPDFDPASDGTEIYGHALHISMNLANTVPGSEWSPKSFTFNPFASWASADPRFDSTFNGTSEPIMRTLGGKRFLFLTYQGNNINIFRFAGEIAVPCGRVSVVPGGPPGLYQLWVDTFGDGTEHGGDITTRSTVADQTGAVAAMYYDVDNNGDIWWTVANRVVHLAFQGVNGQGAPVYNLSGGFSETLWPAPFTFQSGRTATANNLRYDAVADAMYIAGNTIDGQPLNVGYAQIGTTICRYDSWSTLKGSTGPRYTITVPTVADDGGNWFVQDPWTDLGPGGQRPGFKSWHQAGDYIFVWEEFSQIRIWDANHGNFVMSIGPGPEVNGMTGWTDPSQARTFKRASGEYLLTFEDSGQMAKNFVYRWTPNRSVTSLPAICTKLVAAGDNGRILLSWQGPTGFIDSYKVYRSVNGGAEAFLASVASPAFIDTTITAGATGTYRVTSVNVVGEGPYSDPATGHSLIAAAAFVTIDTTTQGTWKGVYGALGNYIFGNTNNLPLFFNKDGIEQRLLNPGSTDVRGLTSVGVGVTTRELQRAYNQGPSGFVDLHLDLNVSDGATHQVALYCVAWNSSGSTQTMTVKNATTGAVLDTRSLSAFDQGSWVVYNISGHVTITATPLGGVVGEVDGVFLA